MEGGNLDSFTDILNDEFDEIANSQPMSISPSPIETSNEVKRFRPNKHAGQYGEFRSVEEIDSKYRNVFSYPFFNLVQSRVIEDVLYSDKSVVVCAPTGSGKTVVFEMAIVKLLMDLEAQSYNEDFKIIYMAPVKAICTERLTEWHSKFNQLGCLCVAVTGDTDVDFTQLKPYRIIITTPEKWDILTRRWTDHRSLVEVIKLFLIDEVHILNDNCRGPVIEAVVSRMRTIEASSQAAHRIEILQRKLKNNEDLTDIGEQPPSIRFIAVSATVSNPEDVATWLSTNEKPAVFYKLGDECRPVKIQRVVEGYPCSEGTSIFKFDIILNYKLWPIILKYYHGKPTLIFCNTRKSVTLTAEALSREITVTFNPEQKAKLTSIASNLKNKKLQVLIMSGVGCHHAGLLYEERFIIENAFRNRDLPILITTTTLAMGVNLPAHLVIIKNTQQYVNGAYQEYSISTILQMVGRAGRPQFDTSATAVIMTRQQDKPRYQALVGGSEPLQSYLHLRLAENLNSEAALRTVTDVAQCVQWLRSTFLFVRAGRDPRRYLGLPPNAPPQLITKKIEELCVKAMNGLASSGLITMDDACCISSTEAGRLMSLYYLDFETMKLIMKIDGSESLEQILWIVCESHELSDMHLRVDERRYLNALNRNNTAATIRFPMKGKIANRQMKLSCIIQAILGCLQIPDPSLNQEATKIMRIADRVCQCLVSYITRDELIRHRPSYYAAILNGITLAKCIKAQLWEDSRFMSRQLRGIGPAFSTLLSTANKHSFMILEESHPRDLERIMNKGPPAGNILKKQVSLLPKYEIVLTPMDQRTVSIKVMLLNQAHLSENIDQLTAGKNHKSYVIVGDSDNCVILLTTFTDQALINVFDGCVTYLIERKHDDEYRIQVHCISSSFVGIDVQAEYTFTNLNPTDLNINVIDHSIHNNFRDATQSAIKCKIDNTVNKARKQTMITDVFQSRKRKTSISMPSAQCNEIRKRESALINKFKSLKESFSRSKQDIRYELSKSASKVYNVTDECENEIIRSPKTIQNIENSHQHVSKKDNKIPFSLNIEQSIVEDECNISKINNTENINEILNNIEKEIMISKSVSDRSKDNIIRFDNIEPTTRSLETNKGNPICINKVQIDSNIVKKGKGKYVKHKGYNQNKKTDNYKFLELLERNVDFSEEDEIKSPKQDGFSETIKSNLNCYLKDTKNNKVKQNTDNVMLNELEITPQKDMHAFNTSIEIKESGEGTSKFNIVTEKDSAINNFDFDPNLLNNYTKINNMKDTCYLKDTKYNKVEQITDNVMLDGVEITPQKAMYVPKVSTEINGSDETTCTLNFVTEKKSTTNSCETDPNLLTNYTKKINIKDFIYYNDKTIDQNQVKDSTMNVIKENKNEFFEHNFKELQTERDCNDIDSIVIRKSIDTLDRHCDNTRTDVNKHNTEDKKVTEPYFKWNNVTQLNSNYKEMLNKIDFNKLTDVKFDNDYSVDLNINLDNIPLQKCPSVIENQLIKKISLTEDDKKPSNGSCDNQFTRSVKVQDIRSLASTSLSTREVKLFKDKTIRNCQLELVKKVIFDVEVTDTVHTNHEQAHVNITSVKSNLGNLYNTRYYTTKNALEYNSMANDNHNTICSHTNINNIFTNKYIMNQDGENIKNVEAMDNIEAYSNLDIHVAEIVEKANEDNDIIKNGQCNHRNDYPLKMQVQQQTDKDGKSQEILSSVDDILNKYSQILRKEHDSTFEKSDNILLQNKNHNHKTKKLFRIKNIDLIEVELPEKLIPHTQKPNTSTNVDILLENIHKEYNDLQHKDMDYTSDIDLEECGQYSQQTQNDNNLDQSMFNPKLLLECFQSNKPATELLEPPLEFADIELNRYDNDNCNVNNINNSDSSMFYTAKELLTRTSPDASQSNNSKLGNGHKTNICQDTIEPAIASISMSITHEVETWTLSPEENYKSDPNPVKAFTAIRNNNYPTNHKTNVNRTEKFNSFKFKNKDKFKHGKKYLMFDNL